MTLPIDKQAWLYICI